MNLVNRKLTAILLGISCVSATLSGCALFPFEEDIPFLGQKTVTVEMEKQTSDSNQEYSSYSDDAYDDSYSSYDSYDYDEYYYENTEEEEGSSDANSSDGSENTGEMQIVDIQPVQQGTASTETAANTDMQQSQAVSGDTLGYATAVSDNEFVNRANLLAAQYDYDAAIALLEGQPDYSANTEMQNAVASYTATKATCVSYPITEITHVFYHILVKDVSKAFDGDSDEAGYNQYMTTIDEFNKITQIMYDKGYVLVSVHDMSVASEDGTMTQQEILLPPGKKPFVLSQDDVSYYHYMDGDGFATRLVLDENGEVKCEYIEDDGSVSVGDYDMVPLLDTFIKQHPDFSYHGRKGIIALTGYDGVLGYRTDIAYKTRENLQEDQQKFLDAHPDFDWDADVAAATKVAEAMKANGWEFASHTWGHRNATTSTAEELQVDNEKWENYVAPIVGRTDIIIFAFGADIGDWQEFTLDNPKVAYFKGRGYNYFCNVDSSTCWVQSTGLCLRQGRRNLDGYRMYYNPEMLTDLFNVSDVWDSSRPTPVPPM